MEELKKMIPIDFFPLLRYLPDFQSRIRIAVDAKKELCGLIDKEVDDILGEGNVDNFVSKYVQREGTNILK